MVKILSDNTFCALIQESELGDSFRSHPLLEKDIWPLSELGYTEEDLCILTTKNIYFNQFQLQWLKLLSKYTILAMLRAKRSPDSCRKLVQCLKALDAFLRQEGYFNPLDINGNLLETFVNLKDSSAKEERRRFIGYAVKTWKEEEWLSINFINYKNKFPSPNVNCIPENILMQIYNNLELFPPPLERLFRLQIALGWRICEMVKLPRNCLKFEKDQWYVKRWIAKRKNYKFYPIHHLIADVIREQQRFIDTELGHDSSFEKLFCWMSAALRDGANQSERNSTRFDIEPVYQAKMFNTQSIRFWLRAFNKLVNLQHSDGKVFQLTTHMFRRTKASIMAYCEVDDEFIAAVLGHASLSSLPHYRQRSLERLEKIAGEKGYVDKYGEVTRFEPKRKRYEKLTALMKVSTPLGECHRPRMLGDCQYRYACLNCNHHRVTVNDRPILENDLKELNKDLFQAESEGAERRVTEINGLIKLLETRLHGLNRLMKLEELQDNA